MNGSIENADHEALKAARQIDPDADHADGAPDCLLIANEHADEVLALFPGAWRDDNDPPTSWTRIVLPRAGHEDVCLAGNPAQDGVCGDSECVCARGLVDEHGTTTKAWAIVDGGRA